MTSPLKKAIVLLSGGLDSSTCLALANQQGFSPIALTFSYGQKQRIELKAARLLAQHFGCSAHHVIDLDLSSYGGSALTTEQEVPKYDQNQCITHDSIPITYVPARNTIFLALALAWAEVYQCSDIFIGVTSVDYSGYPDCRPEYIAAFTQMANLGTRMGHEEKKLVIHAPLQYLSKAEIIRLGADLQVPYELTHTCYDPVDDLACGACEACLLRKRGFEMANQLDPTRYYAKKTA